MENGFYLTLPSNSKKSAELFENTVARFTTQLLHPIHLTGGEWEMALVEMIYPSSFITVPADTFWYEWRADAGDRILTKREYIPKGNYKSMGEIAAHFEKYDHVYEARIITDGVVKGQTVNGVQEFTMQEYEQYVLIIGNFLKLIYNSETNKMTIQSIPGGDGGFIVTFGPEMKALLGLDYSDKEIEKFITTYGPFEGNMQCNLNAGIPREMFIYCDIAEPQLVGDTAAPLLRIVSNTDPHAIDKMIWKTYDTPHYVSVLKRWFDKISIDISMDTGKPVPFESGTSTVKVHFRKRSQ